MDVFDAAKRGDLERVKALVEQDAGLVHDDNLFGWMPLFFAASRGHAEVAQYLVDHGARVNDHRDCSDRTALQVACERGHAGVVLLLLQRGADVTLTNGLIVAAKSGHEAVARVLLAHGGRSVYVYEYWRPTAVQIACDGGHAGVLRQLLEAGLDPTEGRAAIDPPLRNRHPDCNRVLQAWEWALTLRKARSIRDACVAMSTSMPPMDAAPAYLLPV